MRKSKSTSSLAQGRFILKDTATTESAPEAPTAGTVECELERK
jgi:hypothetical protein